MMKASISRNLPRVLPSCRNSRNLLPSLKARGLATVVDPLQRDPVELDQISKLSNGVRVATEALPGHFSAIGVYVDAGSRYENDYLRGVSHIMDRLAFKSTGKRTGDGMLEALESLGGNIQCVSSRESLMYQSATFNSAVPSAVALLAETIRDPLITEEEVQEQLQTASYEIREIWSKPELILPELVHLAAYKDNTLGNPLLCPKERLTEIDKTVVGAYRKAFFKPERMVVAFAGVQHDEAVRLTEKYFGDLKADELRTSSQGTCETQGENTPSHENDSSVASFSAPLMPAHQPSKLLTRIPFFKNLSTSAPSQASILSNSQLHPCADDILAPSRYTGGFLTLPPLPPPVNLSILPLTHIHLAFEALPIHSDDIYALATLQTLLGGGGSFSAGGPGKGMFSRLFTNVLNQYNWVESCVAFNHSYSDSGLFGISASCSPSKVTHMLNAMCQELQALTLDTGFSALQLVEVNRAKNQLRSSLLMNLESRMVELEDLGRQVQVLGRKVGVREMCRKIDALTVQDLRRVAREVLTGMVDNRGHGSGAPTVVLQESEGAGLKRTKFTWAEIQHQISRWNLGRR